MDKSQKVDRRAFIGGSDARIIMGKDQKALLRLWREKRSEEAPLDLSGVLVAQLGLATEDLNRRWYELNSGNQVSDVQRHVVHRSLPWMAATLDGLVKAIAAEKAFWNSVKTGEPPVLFDCEPPKPRIEAVRVVDMNASNSWAELASIFCETRRAHSEHERAKSELKALIPDDVKEAIGHGIRAKRSKSGAISFDLVVKEAAHASLQ